MMNLYQKTRKVVIACARAELNGELVVPRNAKGVVLFAHGSGSGRFSPRNRYVADVLRRVGLATVLADLLTEDEADVDSRTAELRFDIRLLADRLRGCAEWKKKSGDIKDLPLGYFGASTGAAAALVAAAESPQDVFAVVSRGGRPDLAKDWLPRVRAPTLLIVGGNDVEVLRLNREAERLIGAEHRLTVVPGATHLFEENGALESAARLAADWFLRHAASAATDAESAAFVDIGGGD